MTDASHTGTVFVAAAWVAIVGCAATPMQLPSTVQPTPVWQVRGFSAGALRTKDFTLDGRTVRDVHRHATQSSPGNRTVDPAPRGYRFELALDTQVWTAECSEVTDPRKLWILQYGQGTVHLECTCREGAKQRARLSLAEDAGTVELASGAHYEVAAVHQSAAGKHEREALGYVLTNASGTGAVECTGSGRMWPPPALDQAAKSELSCIYAALLLYQPK
jgi:hypothetical protein